MIAHFDMDCFYAAIELREKPYLVNKPVAIGGKEGRGIITTCNYVARSFGVRSAMPAHVAKELCPELIFMEIRFDLYREESRKIRNLIEATHPELLMTSVDEGYVQLSEDPNEAFSQAKKLKKLVLDETGLVVSIGIAPNKMLAKICSGFKKPDALFMLTMEDIPEFMLELPVKCIPGVGPKSQERFKEVGINTCADIQLAGKDYLRQIMGSWGEELYTKSFGTHRTCLSSVIAQQSARKSVSLERTLPEDLNTFDELKDMMPRLYAQLQRRLKRARENDSDGGIAKAFVRLRFDDFTRTSCEKSFTLPVKELRSVETFEDLLFEAIARSTRPVRLIGLGVRFVDESSSVNAIVDPSGRLMRGKFSSGAKAKYHDPRQLLLFPLSA